MPAEERFGLQAQVRRAAVSAAANIVEGSARQTSAEYCRFLELAHASARECSYLLNLAARLGIVRQDEANTLAAGYDRVAAQLLAAIQAIRRADRANGTP
jgi:four helix bundle protein